MLKRFRWNRVRPLDVGLIKLLGVSRSPTYELPRSEKLGVSREVSCQIDLDFTCKPYGSGGSVVKKFAFDVARSRFKCHLCTTFMILYFTRRDGRLGSV